ncbi:putative lipoprotein 10 [Achromobacter xylosoxidans A8]|uniref:Putative lipoprotein 10 n=1 Tax=Achromobacter xylosoxidans (strain A8) TaxID=762376 RepID=E3HNN2_ACHXA|nr:hypothetical protein [Achromobacter xylosoxidans]ADP17071.1 putative lipoprotein 10 [Achromobacter xylosoxidans A8]
MSTRFKKAGLVLAVAVAFSLPLMQGCASSQPEDPRVVAAEVDKPFTDWMNQLLGQVEANPNYRRIPLDTKAQQDQFLVWLHDAYRHRITKQEFTSRVTSQYPGHQNEAAFVASKLP